MTSALGDRMCWATWRSVAYQHQQHQQRGGISSIERQQHDETKQQPAATATA